MNVKCARVLAAPIAALDLSTVRTRLMHPRAGLGWSEARSVAAEMAYREFLLFARDNPVATPSPAPDVDAFWHYHILDTVKYARDCADTFGYFLHHGPDVLFDEDDDATRASYCALTRPASYCALTRPASYCARVALSAPLC